MGCAAPSLADSCWARHGPVCTVEALGAPVFGLLRKPRQDGPGRVPLGFPGPSHQPLFHGQSRLVRNQTPYFIWTNRRDAIDCRFLRKEQVMNHYAKAGSFTTKVSAGRPAWGSHHQPRRRWQGVGLGPAQGGCAHMALVGEERRGPCGSQSPGVRAREDQALFSPRWGCV